MHITVLSLFPNLFNNFLCESIIKKMIDRNSINIEIIDFRNYSKDKRKKVDDYQCGGGGGMIIQLQPIVDCLKKIKTKQSKVILLSPQGSLYNQAYAKKLTSYSHIILICGRYEGFDERLINYVDEIISIGDYVLMGGEIPAMAIIESVARLLDNGINKQSLISESFDNNLLDYPVYTNPKKFDKYSVPEILFSGNHEKINKYRYNQQLLKTKKYRLDLYEKFLREDKKHGKTK
jgi:tRNA (guanine37-N1)-methyltransferase